MAIYFNFRLSIRTFEVTIISVVKSLIKCLVSEILKDEKGQRHAIVIRHLGYSKKSMTSHQGKILFLGAVYMSRASPANRADSILSRLMVA